MNNPRLTPRSDQTPKPDVAVEIDERLDEELDQTFPASDPLPWCHDIVPAVRIRPARGNSIVK